MILVILSSLLPPHLPTNSALPAQGLSHRRIRVAIALQAARGMEYLHAQQIVHFDLKCENFLCDLCDPLRPIVKVSAMQAQPAAHVRVHLYVRIARSCDDDDILSCLHGCRLVTLA